MDIMIIKAIEKAHSAAQTQLAMSDKQIEKAFAYTGWTSIEDMAHREFGGDYQGYFPRVGMWVRSEALVAVVFDTLAESLGDSRRAMRNVSGGDLTNRQDVEA